MEQINNMMHEFRKKINYIYFPENLSYLRKKRIVRLLKYILKDYLYGTYGCNTLKKMDSYSRSKTKLKDFLNQFRYINIEIANKQQIMINKIVVYIKENNYFGDKYHEYRNSQIDATKWWINNFYTEKYSNPEKNLNEIVSFNEQEEKQFYKKLV